MECAVQWLGPRPAPPFRGWRVRVEQVPLMGGARGGARDRGNVGRVELVVRVLPRGVENCRSSLICRSGTRGTV